MPRNTGRLYRARLDFSVLGPLQVRGEDGPIDLPSPMERALLAHLVARAGRTVSTDELIDTLWADTPPRTAAKALQNHVLRLRNILEPGRDGSPVVLVTDGSGYRLNVPDDAVDARRFERLVGLGRRAYQDGRVEAAAATLGEALALWRGPAYAGLESTLFGGIEARRLEELRLVAEEDRIAAELDLGHARKLVAELESLVHEHPLRERFWQLLVLALYRADRQADALAAYSRARDVLVEELGVEPSAELRRLQVQVLEQDSALRAPSRTLTLPDALVPPPGPFFGRVAELATLRAAWQRVSDDGTSCTVVLRGARGAGVTRLAAQFAAELAERGVVVEYHPGGQHPGGLANVPILSVIDLRRSASSGQDTVSSPAEGSRLTVVLAAPNSPLPPNAESIEVGPLAASDVQTILTTYVDAAVVDEVLGEVLRISGGLPGRVHDEALAIARRRAAAAVGGAVARAEQVGSDFDAVRADLRLGVTRYREVIEREAAVETGSCPWKGLVAYGVADAPWFAGRERLVAELLTRLASARLVALVGGSGSGKSSLLHAGLLASLQAGALPGSERWLQLVMRPGTHPMRQMVRAALSGADATEDRVAELLERMVFGAPAAARTVLIVDQFEEVWTACTDPAERESFLGALAEVVEVADRCTVVLGVRADHVARLADQPVLAQALADGTVLVGTATAAEVRRAIEHPAGRAGLVLDVGLADALVDDAGDEPGLLPLLSTALTELWDHRDGRRLTLEAYAQSGGLRAAVARIAERAFGALDEADRAAARVLLLRLAGPGDGDAVTRRRVPLTELAALPDPRVRAVVEPLADARLLTLDAGHVEVAHEALFREWPRLRAWLEEHAAARAVQRRLATAAAEWDEGGREETELWRGTRLVAGAEFATAYPHEVTTVEREFVDAGKARLDAERREAEARAAAATKQNRRLRWLLGGLAVFLVLALVAGGLALRAQSRAEAEARIATARQLAAAAVANLDTDPELAILLATRAVEQTREQNGSVLPEAEEALHRAVVSSRVVATFPNLGGALDWSPDGSMFVTEGTEGSGVIDVRDPESGRSLRTWHGHDVDVNDVHFGADGTLATTGDDGEAVAWDPATGTEVGQIDGILGPVTGPSLSRDGSLLSAAWPADGVVRVLDLRTKRLIRELLIEPGAVMTALSPDGALLAVGLALGSGIVVVDLATGEEAFELHGFDTNVGRIAWSPDGRWVAAAVDDDARVWDATTGALRAVLRGHTTTTTGLDWSADSTRIATGSADGTAKVWELTDEGAREVLTLSASGTVKSVVGVAFSPDGRRLMAGDWAIAAVAVFAVDLTENAEWTNIPAPAEVTGVDFFPDGKRLASSDNVSAAIWDVDTGRSVGRTGVHGPSNDPTTGTRVFEVDVSPDGTQIATATETSVKVWDAVTGAEVFAFARDVRISDIDWNHDGSSLAVAHSGVWMVQAWETTIVDRAGKTVREVGEHGGFVTLSAEFSPDGSWLATGRAQNFFVATQRPSAAELEQFGVTIWDWRRQLPRISIDAKADSMAASPDSTMLVTADRTGPARIWDVRSGELQATLAGHAGGIEDVAFSPDGATVATAGIDGTIRLWNASSGEHLLTLPGHTGVASTVQFSPDGTKLASTGTDGVVRVWALDLDALLRIAGENVTRDLTSDECRRYHVDPCS